MLQAGRGGAGKLFGSKPGTDRIAEQVGPTTLNKRAKSADAPQAERIDRLRPSRDGDQFHYWWAARRSLALLQPSGTLVAISVEGVPSDEAQEIGAGLDAIDVAEYHGSKDPHCASAVHYYQLKHATRRADEPWKAHDLGSTLGQFAKRFIALLDTFDTHTVTARFTFAFLTNRPIAKAVQDALALLQAGKTDKTTATLQRAIGLEGEALRRFANLLTLTGDADSYLEQRRLLDLEHVRYLPGRDEDAPVQLKEIVTRRATSEYLGRPEIERYDVLKALGVHETELQPAPCRIERPHPFVERAAIAEVAEAIVAANAPLIVTADGGEGKSVLALHLGAKMPPGSTTFVYDCFGSGSYRSATGLRHRAADGLVQLGNEIAAAKLCAPLIPSPKASGPAYVRAFVDRVEQAAAVLEERSPTSLLCLVIDAADNAEMIAAEMSDGPSFPRQLLRETWPANVRLVLLARGYRVHLLDPTPATAIVPIGPFTEVETLANLQARNFTPNAAQLAEFHRLTSRNPRVQAAIVAEGGTLPDILARLGPKPLNVDGTIRIVLARALARVEDELVSGPDRARLKEICRAMATLRPPLPIDIVARIADVPAGMVRSFVQDIGGAIIVANDALQFRDEPTESWFRDTYKPDAHQIGAFVARVAPLAPDNTYVATCLPQLLLEANRFDELVQLALTGGALPNERLARREVELQRLQFAIKAAVRQQRWFDAARLALKAANESAAQGRQQRLLGANSDLAARFVDAGTLADRVSRREIPATGWTGSEHAYAAAMLSGIPLHTGDASSQLRQTKEWLRQWVDGIRTGTAGQQRVEARDVAEMAMAELNLNDPNACARSLRRWRKRVVSYEAGRMLVARLIDASRLDDVDALALAAGNDLGLILALCCELDRVGRQPHPDAVRRALRIALRPGLMIDQCAGFAHETARLFAMTVFVIAAARLRAAPDRALGALLGRYIGDARCYFSARQPAGVDDREVVMRAYAVRAVLLGRTPTATAIARLGSRSRKRDRRERDQLRQEFNEVLPWYRLAAEVDLGRLLKRQIASALQAIEQATAPAHTYTRIGPVVGNARAGLWIRILLMAGLTGPPWRRFDSWRDRLERPLFVRTLAEIARHAARTTGFDQIALEYAATAFRLGAAEHDHAEQGSDMCVTLARAVLPLGDDEARAYFDQAVASSERIGDENIWRFETLLYAADVASAGNSDDPEIAYRLSRAGELTYALVARDKHFDYWHAIEAVTRLSPRSGPVILSRWQDRRFGTHRQLLSELLAALEAKGELDPLDALCLLPLDAAMNEKSVLDRALASATADPRGEGTSFAIDYMRFGTHPSEAWDSLLNAAKAQRMDGAVAAEELARATRREASAKESARTPAALRRRLRSKKLDKCFAGLNVSVPGDLRVAAARVKAISGYAWRQNFVVDAWSRMPAGRLPGLFRGFVGLEAFGAFDLKQLLDLQPNTWDPRPAERDALAALVRAVARRDEHAASVTGHYKVLNWASIESLCGVSIEEAIRLGAETLAATAEVPDAQTLFTLVTRWTRLLTPAEAGEVLRFGLILYEPLHQASDGDGPWRAELAPPASVQAALAGYIWAALGDPAAARRWGAAHVVRGLCRLERHALLGALIDRARRGVAGSFGAPAYHFYSLHALQWLVIALARAATESGAVVVQHVDFLRDHASPGQPHIMIRSFAASAILELHRQALVALTALEVTRLVELATPSPQLFTADDEAKAKTTKRRRQFDPDDRSRLLIGLDFDRSWIEPLAVLIGSNQANFEARMAHVVRHDWGLEFSGRWDEDARAAAGLFESTKGYGETMPDVDDLSRYLNYHALQVAAGELLALAKPAPDDRPEWDRRTYTDWFAEHRLTRSDGNWLFDRRDVVPADLVDVPRPRGAWIGSAREADLTQHLEPMPGWVTVAADVDRYAGQDSEEIIVTSALVAPDSAKALARSLQVAERNYQRLPGYRDRDDIEHARYWLRGWVDRRDHERGLDGKDSWSGGLHAAPFEPGDAYRDSLALVPENLNRAWRHGHDLWLRSDFWSEDEDGEDMRFARGARLLASTVAIDRLLDVTDSTLIVSVRVTRGRYQMRYEHRDKEGPNDSQLTRNFLFERGGRLWTPRRGYRAWPHHRQRNLA